MAWNRPTEENVKAKGEGEQRSVHLKGLIAGVICVLGAGIAAWWLWPTGETRQDAASTKKELIREVKPAIARTNETAAITPDKPKELPPQQVGETRNGYIMLCDGRLHRVKGVITNQIEYVKEDYEIFDHFSENVIAGLLSLEPGTTLIGTPMYNGRFKEDFLKSLAVPIIATASDSEHDRTLKRLVNEAKIELKAAYDRGEDVEKVILDAREELQKLARYRNELEAMTVEGINSASTPEEVDDYITAANKMLEQKGIAPMDLSPLAKLKLKILGHTEEK